MLHARALPARALPVRDAGGCATTSWYCSCTSCSAPRRRCWGQSPPGRSSGAPSASCPLASPACMCVPPPLHCPVHKQPLTRSGPTRYVGPTRSGPTRYVGPTRRSRAARAIHSGPGFRAGNREPGAPQRREPGGSNRMSCRGRGTDGHDGHSGPPPLLDECPRNAINTPHKCYKCTPKC